MQTQESDTKLMKIQEISIEEYARMLRAVYDDCKSDEENLHLGVCSLWSDGLQVEFNDDDVIDDQAMTYYEGAWVKGKGVAADSSVQHKYYEVIDENTSFVTLFVRMISADEDKLISMFYIDDDNETYTPQHIEAYHALKAHLKS